MPSPTEERCRFDELGRFQFELLCRELLVLESGGAASDWHEFSRGEALFAPEALAVPGSTRRLETPALVVATWTRSRPDEPAAALLRAAVNRAVEEWRGRDPHSLLVLTNLEAQEDLALGIETEILDAGALTRLVHSRAALRLRLPSLLGVCDPSAIAPEALRARSSADVEAALALARVFVPTRAYGAALAALEQFCFTVLTGPPEMGKTAIARMVGLARMSDGWEFHECVRPEELWHRFARDRRQVFVADDAFGSTEHRPDAAERWAIELDRVLRELDAAHWLIWTSRPGPLHAALRRIHREHELARFPRPAEVQVDASALGVEEKALILFRHAKAAQLSLESVELVRAHGFGIVSHAHFTPERIRRFVAGRLLQPETLAEATPATVAMLIADEIREPTEAMAESFRALSDEHRAVLVALLDVPPGPASEREIAAAVRRLTAHGWSRQPSELFDRLTDHFVRMTADGAVSWIHPSWRDLVIDELAGDSTVRQAFLRACSLEGILLALSSGGGASGERSLPLLQADADWDALTDGLAGLTRQLEPPDVTRLLVALADALARGTDSAAGELGALATFTLELLAGRWERERTSVPLGLLARWAELRRLVPARVPFPDVAAAWIERLPAATPPADEFDALDEWLDLVELLEQHEPERLRLFGFPEQQLAELTALLDRVDAAHGHASDHRALARVLHRLADLVPALGERAREAAWRVAEMSPVARPVELYVPRQISPAMLEIIDAPRARPRHDERLVSQVLRDL